MEVLFIVIVVIALAALIGIATQDRRKKKVKQRPVKRKPQTFREQVQSTFPKYKVTEKNGQTIIYEINHRNEPDELVFIRLGQEKKEIKLSGRMLIASYEKQPTPAEMRRDFWNLD